MAGIDPTTLAPWGPNARARERRTWPRCPGCGERMHPTLTRAGAHALCSPLPPATWDRLAGWAS